MVFDFNIFRNGLAAQPVEGLEVEVDVENRRISFGMGVVRECVSFGKNYSVSFCRNSFAIQYREKDGPVTMIDDANQIVDALKRIGYISISEIEIGNSYTLNFVFPADAMVTKNK